MKISSHRLVLILCFLLMGWSTGAFALADSDRSRGFTSRDDVAVEHYIQSAEKNDPHAQYMLGRMYATGERIQRNYPEAYKWLHLAETNGVREAAELKRKISRRMSGEQIAEARRHIEDWQQRHGIAGGDSDIDNPEIIRQVQQKLAREGFYRGAIDGIIGKRTSDAIRKYQLERGLVVNGRVTSSLLDDIGLTQYLPSSSPFPGSSGKDGTIGDSAAIKKELRKIIRQAQREDAAEPWLLRRLKDLAESGTREWPHQVLREPFTARDYHGGDDWRTLEGNFILEPGTGLIATSSSSWGSAQDRSNDLAQTLLEILLQGRSSAPKKMAEMENDISFADAFALRVRTGSLDETEGLVFSVTRKSESEPGYKVVFHPGQGERAKFFEIYGNNAREIIAQANPIRLEDRASHTFEWTRSASGEMRITVDGKQLLQANSPPGVEEPFDTIGIAHIGDRIVFQDIELSDSSPQLSGTHGSFGCQSFCDAEASY